MHTAPAGRTINNNDDGYCAQKAVPRHLMKGGMLRQDIEELTTNKTVNIIIFVLSATPILFLLVLW